MREALGSRYERATKIAHKSAALRGRKAFASGAEGARAVAARAPPLALHLDVLDKDFTNEDDLIGSVPLGPLLEGGGDAGRQEKVELRRADGEKGGVVSFSWRLVRSCEMIDIWQPASGTTPRRDMEPGW